jgi:DNA repair photolyase
MIISASRRTDIPAFYSDWFFNRLNDGIVDVRNPVNKNLISRVLLNPQLIDCIVLWTKNPKPLMKRLKELESYNYYFQFSLNPYDKTLEPSVPKKTEIIKTFTELSNKIGKHRVNWRYDPIFYTDKIDFEYHVKYFEKLAIKLHKYTERCTISFIDLYKKTERNLKGTTARELTEQEMIELSSELVNIANKYNLVLETCSEDINLDNLGIGHGKCIDNKLIERIINGKLKTKKDKYQRTACGCVESIDIGAYNTCLHKCLYCYANFNNETVKKNWNNHNPKSSLLFGEIKEKDIIKERNIKSFITKTLFD